MVSTYLQKYLNLLEFLINEGQNSSIKETLEEELFKLWYYYLSPADKIEARMIREKLIEQEYTPTD